MARTALTLSDKVLVNDKVKFIESKKRENLSTKELITQFKWGKNQIYDAIKK